MKQDLENKEKINQESDAHQETDEIKDDSQINDLEKNQKQNKKPEKKEKHDKLKKDQLEKLKKLSQEELLAEYQKLLKKDEDLHSQQAQLKKNLQDKEKEAHDYLDKYRRSLAEMENVRKRAQTERQDFAKYANFKIIEDLLNILDDFQRAIDSAKAGNIDFENYKEGIELIEKQFIDLLFKKYAVVKYGQQGDAFDPNYYQAMMMEEGDFKEEIVAEVFRNGYKLHERVIRPAQVKVGKPSETQE